MAGKRIVQVYKPGGGWRKRPPGLGDFIRGACHLHELASRLGVDLRIDVSTTGFAALAVANDDLFHTGSTERDVLDAGEYFREPEHAELIETLDAFCRSQGETIFVCTNLGAWNRTRLEPDTIRFMRRFYDFAPEVVTVSAATIGNGPYEVLSVRAGDRFFQRPDGTIDVDLKTKLFEIIERQVLPQARSPLVVMSDSFALKSELAARFGVRMTPGRPQHGADGSALPVAVDLNLLKGAAHVHHVNLWKWWWSGFSHYTSLIFSVPSTNYVAPLFVREDSDAAGRRRVAAIDRVRLHVQAWRRAAWQARKARRRQ
jgi:hypothetical protein